MEFTDRLAFVDQTGQPLNDRIQQVLRRLLPDLRKRYPFIVDDVVITEILEEAGQRIADRERQFGPVQNLPGYASVIVRHVAASRMRQRSMRVEELALDAEESHARLSALPSDRASADQIEREMLLKQIAAQLSPNEKVVWTMKQAERSSREIADCLKSSVAAVDTLFHRMKPKVRAMLRAVPRPPAGKSRK